MSVCRTGQPTSIGEKQRLALTNRRWMAGEFLLRSVSGHGVTAVACRHLGDLHNIIELSAQGLVLQIKMCFQESTQIKG
jgi:hypothetical protein